MEPVKIWSRPEAGFENIERNDRSSEAGKPKGLVILKAKIPFEPYHLYTCSLVPHADDSSLAAMTYTEG